MHEVGSWSRYLDSHSKCWQNTSMGALAFFPWFCIDQDLIVDAFELRRFERHALPGGPEQAAIDAVLEPYLLGENSISSATLLTTVGSSLTADLGQPTISDFFEVAELIAFSGLAAR